jgi:hypothetical protein
MGRRDPRDDCWFRVVASVSQLERQTTGMDEKQVCRQLADFAIALRERRINVEAGWKRQTRSR